MLIVKDTSKLESFGFEKVPGWNLWEKRVKDSDAPSGNADMETEATLVVGQGAYDKRYRLTLVIENEVFSASDDCNTSETDRHSYLVDDAIFDMITAGVLVKADSKKAKEVA